MQPCRGIYSRGGYNCGIAFDGDSQALYPTFGGDTELGKQGLPWGNAWVTRLATPLVQCPTGGACIQVLTYTSPTSPPEPGYVRIER
jgi:hypothetical protein